MFLKSGNFAMVRARIDPAVSSQGIILTPHNCDLNVVSMCLPLLFSVSPAASKSAGEVGFTSGEEGKGRHHRKWGRCCVIGKELRDLDLLKCRIISALISGKPKRMRRTTSPSEVSRQRQELRPDLGPGLALKRRLDFCSALGPFYVVCDLV